MDLNIQFLVHSNYKNCSNSDHFSESLSESDTGSPLLTSAIRWHLEAPPSIAAFSLSPSSVRQSSRPRPPSDEGEKECRFETSLHSLYVKTFPK